MNEVVTQLVTRVGAMKRCGDEPSLLVGQAEREEQVHVALDGKTLRGTLSHEAADQRKMHQVALYEMGTGLVLKEQVVGEKENELSMVSQFLSPVWVKGRIISADARPTQLTFCSDVTYGGGYFLLVAKGNQPTLRDDLQLFFSEPEARLPGLAHGTHGRLWPWTTGDAGTGGKSRTQRLSGGQVDGGGTGLSTRAHRDQERQGA